MKFDCTVPMIFYFTIIVGLMGEACAQSRYYSLTTSQKETEEKVFHNVYHQQTLFGSMKNAIVDMLPNICNIFWTERLIFCQEILKAQENGFRLNTVDTKDMNCQNVSPLIHFLTRSTLEKSTLSAFFCPSICYDDLETDERKCLPNYRYGVSKALQHDSASIFFQKDPQSVWYPLYQVADIDFKRLEWSDYDYLKIRHKATVVNDDENVQKYLQAKRVASPYEKFTLFYASINLCGRRRPQIVYLCRTSIKEAFNTKNVKFDLTGYDEYACKNYTIFAQESSDDEKKGKEERDIEKRDKKKDKKSDEERDSEISDEERDSEKSDKERDSVKSDTERDSEKSEERDSETSDDENHVQLRNELTMVRCPPVQELSSFISPKRKYFDLYYIASNLKRHSTTLFIRRNRKGQLPVQEANIENLPLQPVIRDIRRSRFLPPASKTKDTEREKSYREIEEELANSVAGDVRTPSTLTRLDETSLKEMLQAEAPSKPSLNKWLADDSVIAFSKVKSIKFIYTRFKVTYRSIDIGQLSMRQKAVLCNDVLNYYQDPHDINRIPITYGFRHIRQRVRLTRREVVGLETNILFSLFECPSDMRNFFGVYFVGKNHLENTATIYKIVHIWYKSYYYPHAFISGINRYKLAHFVKHS